MNNTIIIETGALDVHPLAAAVTCQTKKGNTHRYTMENFGQVEPISVVEREGKLLIIDGIERYHCAKQNPVKFASMECRVLEIADEKIVEKRSILNATRKKSIREKCKLVESVLGLLGKSQGVKRKALGINGIDLSEKYSNKIKLDRYHFAAHIAGVDESAPTLRKLMAIYNYEGVQREKILDLLDSGRLSIDKGYNVLLSKKKKEQELEELKLNHFGTGEKGSFQLFCGSSLAMDAIPDSSVRLCINSHPYFQLRKYRNQGEAPHGQEKTVKEYVEKFVTHCREVRSKLLPNGVLVTILGETYRDGYQGVCTKVETALENDGWRILDVNIWEKTNQKYAPHPSRFGNGYERIIVACKSDERPVFSDIKKPSAIGDFRVIKSADLINGDCNYTMSTPMADITNVFRTSTFNKSEHNKIDSEFTHDAPAPEVIYEAFVKAYSLPGETVLDNFVGSGTVGVALKLGRNVIGCDIDPVSIRFARKRFEKILGNDVETVSMAA